MSALEVQDLVCGYLATPVLRGVSFSAAPGEVVALLGPNGAGKTTLLKTLSGLVQARSGTVTVGGRDVTNLRTEKLARAGVILAPEGRRLFTGLTVRENLRIGALTGREAPGIEEVLELFPRLRERIDFKAGSLSGGEQQMLTVGRALIGGPGVLLIDEPSLGLAPKLVAAVFDVFGSLAAQGRAVMVAEQNVGEAIRVADRCLVLADGGIALSAPSRTEAERAHVQAEYARLLAIELPEAS
ncbi:ABC transporter ATP-binding protein [Actinomadura sp. KC345]|uniref:ABC transporter ATP-binding protein n=1 Tax=Actinomadura sp. KC345 TaxID=2530371 RepID=UPI0010474AD0|nr:ABC transporter ATP-binding protein [Actinomadura sp. KC345]TDC58548.1 ABC transporter ATP-binding protein [Actinomadura sp. KC345]